MSEITSDKTGPPQDIQPMDIEGEVLEKKAIKINDEAGEYAVQALASGAADPVAAKKVLRKIDLYLLPLLCVTFGKRIRGCFRE